MLEDLLDTSRALYGKLGLEKRRVEVKAVAQAVVSDQQARAASGSQIVLEGAEAWVDADPVRLAQMIENLVENALKYGGRSVRVTIESDDTAVHVRVEDDGQGIAPELLPRLFQPFVQGEQTLDRAQGGLGLGLALVDRLAALHGGSLSAQSEGLGKGATFALRLPAAAPGAPAASEVAPAPLRQQRFLVVEDDADARERLEQLLLLEGHEVMAAASGAEALASAGGWAPNAALLDIGLPGMDGYELARRLRTLPGGGALILVAVTGYGQREDRGKALAAGFDAHVTKPYTYQELMRALAGVSRRGGGLPPAQQAA
jgi:CheY-like chemotaxis protein/two-component sensor histidine kinase